MAMALETISSTDRSLPEDAERAFWVSHQAHSSGQPASRTKTQGLPAQVDSPWRERKISWMHSCLQVMSGHIHSP